MTSTPPKILIVEDEALIALEIEQCLLKDGYAVISGINSSAKAVETVALQKPDLVLMDIRLKGEPDGIETAALIRTRFATPVVFLTAYLDDTRIERAKLTLPFGYLIKPVQEKNLRVTIEMALYMARMEKERRQAEISLKESERKYRDLFENNRDGVTVLDGNGSFLEANQAYCDMLGYTIEELAAMKDGFLSITPEKWHDWERDEVWNRRLMLQGYTGNYEKEYIRRDGTVFPVEVQGFTVFNEPGKPSYICGVVRDISARKQTEKEVLLLRNQLTNIFNAIPSIIVTVDDRLRIVNWNQKAEARSGLSAEQAKGRPFGEVLPQYQTQLNAIQTVLTSGEIRQEPKVTRHEGKKIYYDSITISPLITDRVEGAVIKIDDVTEKVRMAEIMIQTEKMMSVGGLAAGMAHELNNPLGGMLQGIQNISRRLAATLPANREIAAETGIDLDRLQDYLEKRGIFFFLNGIRDSGKKAADIISNMLQFSRRSESKMAPVLLDRLLEKTLELAGKNYSLKTRFDFRSIPIIREYDPDLPPVPCTETEIDQVFLNLLTNAPCAMADAGTPQARIRLRTKRENGMARIEIEDNGPGMDLETRKRIFEPFFTTKPVGEGTGLGLSVSFMIITNNHRGTIEVESELGMGARFIIRLPLVREEMREIR